MSEFTTPLKVSPIGNNRWELLEDFSFYTDDGEWIIVVNAGFTTDFASIPRALWWLYPPYGETWGKAAVVHDYLYATQEHPDGTPFARKWADVQFLDGMRALGANWARRTLMYQAVRWGAGAAWANHKKRIAKEGHGVTVGEILKRKRG